MICRTLVGGIDVYKVGSRVLYAKTGERNFALFEDELTLEELEAIARDIAARVKKSSAQGGVKTGLES